MSILTDIADLTKTVRSLTERIVGIETELAALEAHVGRNDQRLADTERLMEEHHAGAERRQAEVNKVAADTARVRHALRTGRQP